MVVRRFQFGDVISGEPQLYLARDSIETRNSARLQQARCNVSADLLRKVAIASCAAALLLVLGAATAARAGEAPSRWMTPACAARDLQLMALIEEHGEASDLPAALLAAAGLAHLNARLTCLEGHTAEAIVAYDAVLSAIAARARGEKPG